MDDVKSMLQSEGVEKVLSSEPKTIEHGIEKAITSSQTTKKILKSMEYTR